MNTSDQSSTTPSDADPQAIDRQSNQADSVPADPPSNAADNTPAEAPADDQVKPPATKTLTGRRRRAYILGGGFGPIIGM